MSTPLSNCDQEASDLQTPFRKVRQRQCLSKDGEKCGHHVRRLMFPFHNPKSSSGACFTKIASRPLLPLLYPGDAHQYTYNWRRRKGYSRSYDRTWMDTASFESWFINSLVSAGNCRQYCSVSRPADFFGSARRSSLIERRHINDYPCQRQQRTTSEPAIDTGERLSQPERKRSPDELMKLVDEYQDPYGELPELPPRFQPSDGPHLTVSDRTEDEWPPQDRMLPLDSPLRDQIVTLIRATKDYTRDPEQIYQLYRELPAPRVCHLPSKIRHWMLNRLAVVEKKDEHSMLRYFSVLDDMKVSAIPLTTIEWNSAISFAARYAEVATEVEVESALRLWREMELVAGKKGDHVTFNILFDVACKAGKFVLAEMIYKEMQARGLEFNRYHHVTLITFHGLQKNGDAVRSAYKNLVKAQEIVDTRVMTAMISALINCDEDEPAMNIYERMKQAHLERSGGVPPPRRDWRAQRVLDKALLEMAKIARDDPAKALEYQQTSVLSPNVHTYRTLMHHFAVKIGALEKATKFIEEMKWFEIPLDERIFLALLRGFAIHGGIRYTLWTEARLVRVWKALLHVVDNHTDGLVLSRRLVVWALRAFAQCSGKARTLKAWEEAKSRWDPGEADTDFVMSKALRPILEGEDMQMKRDDWLLGSL